VTTNPGSNGDSLDGEVSSEVDDGSSVSSESGPMEEESDSGVKLDVSPLYDVPPATQCWTSYLSEEEALAAHPDCTLGPLDPNLYAQYYEICVDHPPDGNCADICPPDMLCFGMQACFWSSIYGVCGPYETADACCLIIAGEEPPPIGRPFVIAGAARLAQQGSVPGDRVAAHWLEHARGEHASIAAFARFVGILQRHGAPARLLAEAIAAAADEARHAEQTLALASRFAGRELELGALVVDDALRDTDDLAAALRAAVLEGCIDETLAAHEAACLAAHAEHPEVASVLEQIAADEARHAALAWKFVAWVLGERPELRTIVVEAFSSVAVTQPDESLESPEGDALGLGCPPAGLRAQWRRVGLRELVGPCAARLLEASRTEPLAQAV
jgi:rubrerythrin